MCEPKRKDKRPSTKWTNTNIQIPMASNPASHQHVVMGVGFAMFSVN